MKNIIALFGTCFFIANCFAQTVTVEKRDSALFFYQQGKIKFNNHQNNEALFDFRKALSFCKTSQLDTVRASILMNLVGVFTERDSIEYYSRKAIELLVQLHGKKSLGVANAMNNYAGLLVGDWDIEGSISMRLEALQILLEVSPKNISVPIVCTNLGNLYSIKKDLYMALFYHQKAVEYSTILNKNWNEKVVFYGNLAFSYGALYQMEKAWDSFESAETLIKEGGINQDFEISHLDVQSDLYFFDGKMDAAIRSGKQFYKALTNQNPRNLSLLSAASKKLAERYFAINELDSSLNYCIQSILYASTIPDRKGSGIVEGNRLIGKILFKQAHYLEAIDYFEQSLRANNYLNNAINEILLPDEGFQTLIELSKTYLAIDSFQKSIDLVKQADSCLLMEYFRLEDPASKIQFIDDSRGFYDNLLEYIYKPFKGLLSQNDLFYYVEQSKSRMLYSALKASNALQFSDVPDSLIQKEQSLKKSISRYQHEKIIDKNYTRSSLQDRQKIARVTIEYTQLLSYLEKNYPKYYKAKYNTETISLEDAKFDLLEAYESLIEYYMTDSTIFILVVQQNRFNVVEIPMDFPLVSWINDLRQGITGWADESYQKLDLNMAKDQFARAAYNLYQKLIAPVDSLIPANHRIIIIPDGQLSYLPFEVLLKTMPSDLDEMASYPFWIMKRDISYCYSATLLRELKERNVQLKPKLRFLGMAPSYANGQPIVSSSWLTPRSVSHVSLKFNDQEVDTIQKIIGGQIFVGMDATESMFCDTAFNYQIIHIAGHGEADDRAGDYSYLAFFETPNDSIENEWLFVREIYNLQLNAELIVLSACQTGLGQLHKGEGIIGLTRAFSYAGAKSIVNSLWNVDDHWTMLLMAEFYQNLKKGQRKDTALANAKRAFILNGGDGREHPLFWAGFIGIGDMSVIEF